jgi:WD40 repeat protein
VKTAVWRDADPPGEWVARDTSPPPGGGDDWLVALSPDGRAMGYTAAGAVWLQPDLPDVRAGLPSRFGVSPEDMRFGPGGRLWLAGVGGLLGWREGAPDVRADVPRGARVRPVRCLAAGRGLLLAGGADGRVYRFSPAGGRPTAEYPVFPVPISALALAADESVAVAGSEEGGVRVIELPGGRVLVDLPGAHRDEVTAAAVRPGGWFATGSRDKAVKLWNRSGDLVLSVNQTRPAHRVFVSSDGQTLTTLAAGERGLRRWDLVAQRRELAALGLDPGLPE